MRSRSLFALALVVVTALAWAGGAATVDAGKAKAVLALQFGPGQVEADTDATFVLTVSNTGTADAALALGDRISVVHSIGDGGADLLAAGSELVVDTLPQGMSSQGLTDQGGNPVGLQLSVEGTVTIASGDALVLLFRGVSGAPGAARVNLSTKISKKRAKAPKRLAAAVVVKTPVGGTLPQFYGDGSDGPLDAAVDLALEPLRNYTDVLVRTGVTVTVASGATIRCTGTFENRGTIVVGPGAPGGGVLRDDFGGPFVADENIDLAVLPWGRGHALTAAGRPGTVTLADVSGASGGRGLGDSVFALPISHYRRGGGGGSGALGAVGGDGGGVLRVIARRAVTNGGAIVASGAVPTVNRLGLGGFDGRGAGGGGGGVVILASGESVDNAVEANGNGPAATGTIDVSGADAGQPDALGGGGGGGGGGLVVFVAPAVGNFGTTILDGGASQTQLGNTPEIIFCGGGGGGGSVGDGGAGSGVLADGDLGPFPDGDGGFVLPTLPEPGQLVVRQADPRSVWH